jgi:peptidoglycan/LPS O-acetylase OafA/YrhL
MRSGFSRGDSAEHTISSVGFRRDIEGLRALAVLSVVLFHLKVPIVPGGFSGVDIFFVISGYLITRNILLDMESGRFTFRDFYSRRIRRIFPALLATVTVTLGAGALWFPPAVFIDLAKSSFSSLAFFSNVYFYWNTQQYFSSDSDFLPLLHLWSLSVEEQFYIFWPVVILAVSRTRLTARIFCIGILGTASFAAAFLVFRLDRSAAFYLMPFRAYQFGLGALVFCVERWLSSNIGIHRVAQISGLTLCFVGLLALGPESRIVGVLSSVGAALIIYGGYARAVIPVLTNSIAVYVGQISYSLYLVHWPLAVFANYVFGAHAFGPFGLFIQVALMLLLATLVHRFVERPFLSPHKDPKKTQLVGLPIGASATLAAISLAVILGGGWNWRLNDAQRRINELEAFGVAPCARERDSCSFGASDGPTAALLVGDSYAQHYVAGIHKIATGLGLRVDEHIQHGCLVLSGLLRLGYPDDRCRTGRDRILAVMKKSTAPIIISEAWMGYLDGSIGDDLGQPIDVKSEERRLDVLRKALEHTIDEIARPGRHILIIGAQVLAACDFGPARLGVGPLPHERDIPCGPRSREDAIRATNGVNDMLATVQAEYPDVISLVRPVAYVCEATCPLTRDGISLYQDAGHLTVAGSLYFGDRAGDRIANLLLNGA